MYPTLSPQEIKIFGISPEMRRFGGKWWEKLWIGWNWPFQVNLSLILGEKMRQKIENPVKWPNLAIMTQSKQLFRPNLQLWVILSHIGVKQFEKVGKLKKDANVPPPGMKKWIQVKVTFWFWLMYPPTRNGKVGCRSKWHFGSSWCTHPPPTPEIEIGLNMNAIGKKIISREVIKYI